MGYEPDELPGNSTPQHHNTPLTLLLQIEPDGQVPSVSVSIGEHTACWSSPNGRWVLPDGHQLIRVVLK